MKILLLQLKRIGDLVLTTPAITALRENFPDAEITLVVARETTELLPAIANVDRIFVARRNLRDMALFFSVMLTRFDYCIDFTRNDRSALLAFLSGARRRVVSYRVREQAKTRARAYTDFVGIRMRDMHTIDYHLTLLEPLGAHNGSMAPRLDLPELAFQKVETLRRHHGITGPYVVLHAGSARREKLWEANRWARVIDHIIENLDMTVVLTSGASPEEEAHVAAIKAGREQQIVDLSGKTDLLTMGALISKARLLLTVDSAPMHLAAATRTPQVILFGPTNPFHWRPRGTPAVILQGTSGAPVTEFLPVRPRVAMSEISTQAVIGAMESLLSVHATAQYS